MDLNVALQIEVAKRRLVQLWFPMQHSLTSVEPNIKLQHF